MFITHLEPLQPKTAITDDLIYSRRWWIIQPARKAASISLNITFLAVERGFDAVTVFACPNGKCKEIQWYSDYELELQHYDEWNGDPIPFYSKNVKCNSLTVNTDELRIRFTSDGQLAGFKDTNPIYKGFSSAYWSSPSNVDEEHVGCPNVNTTLSGTEGSVFAFDDDCDINVVRNVFPDFWAESETRGCAHNSGEACSVFGRGQSKWWIISPPKQPGDKIFIAFREVILDDNLDVLSIYTRTNNVTTKETSLTGASPFSYHKAEKCTGCMSSCGLYVGAAGNILEWSNQTRNGRSTCVWIIDAASLGFLYLYLDFEVEMLRGTDQMTITRCWRSDSSCQRRTRVLSPYRPGSFYSETGIIKITWNSAGHGSYQGFQASWTGVCKSDPEITPSGRLSPKPVNQDYRCVWTIAQASAQAVTVDFTYLAGRVSVYSGTTSLYWDPRNDELLGHASSDNNQTTFTSDTGILHIKKVICCQHALLNTPSRT